MNKLIDLLSEYLAHNKAMPVIAGVALILLNYALVVLDAQFMPALPVIGFVARTHLLLHLGLIVGLLGILVGDAL